MAEREYRFESPSLCYKHRRTEAPPLDSFFPHSHNLYELLYFVSGDATYVIEDRKYKLKRGDLVIIRPAKHHYMQIDASLPYERYDFLFDEALLGGRTARVMGGTEIVNLANNGYASELFRKADYYCDKLPAEDFHRVATLLLEELFFNIGIEEKENAEYAVSNPLLSQALGYIREHLFTLKDVGELARALFVSEGYLFRLFKQELKNTPKRYITEQRLLAAERLLSQGVTPTAAAARCGFQDYATFYRRYTEFFRRRPSEVRREALK